MPFPDQNYNKRDYLLPTGCKDLADALKREKEAATKPPEDPPISRYVSLPKKVSVKFVAEISGQSLITIRLLMHELRIYIEENRGLDFSDAARLLRRYGIGANADIRPE
jgi:hypothetical protein